MPALLVSDRLPETASRKDWGFAYVASSDPTALADGSLTVTERTGVRVRRTISSRYAVQFEPAPAGCRCFLLLKEGHAGDLDTKAGRDAAVRCGEVYRVTVTPVGVLCSCPGFVAGKRPCKHTYAVKGLLDAGDLPDPCEAGHDRFDAFRETCEAMPEDPAWDRLAGVGGSEAW